MSIDYSKQSLLIIKCNNRRCRASEVINSHVGKEERKLREGCVGWIFVNNKVFCHEHCEDAVKEIRRLEKSWESRL